MKKINYIFFSSLIILLLGGLISPLTSCKGKSSNPSESESIGDSVDGESESEVTPPTPITLNTPVLFLDEDTGLVTWEKITNAEYYRYYINAGETKQTTSNSLTLTSGQSVSVIAESTLEHVSSSQWSKPVTYYEGEETNKVVIAFANSKMNKVTIQKGSTYTPSNPETKKGYTFEGWYLDGFYKTKLTSDYVFLENTILYANYIKEAWTEGVSYWLWASPVITSVNMTSLADWNYIPLFYDEAKSLEKDANVFSTVVTVNGVSATTPAEFIGTDGAAGDHPGRQYFKNGLNNFTINQDGTYRIYLSAQYFWTNGTNMVNCHIEYLNSSSTEGAYNEHNIPLGTLSESYELDNVVINLGSDGQSVYWEPIANATSYQYIIDNGQVLSTTSNSVPLSLGSYITVRAISTKDGYLPSKWSAPYYRELPKGDEYVYVYFYGANKTSEKIIKGSKISRPNDNPVKKGYTFDNWYTDITYTSTFDFNKEISKNTTIYAKFNVLTLIRYSLYEGNMTTKIADLEWSSNYSHNEYKVSFECSDASSTVTIKDNETGEFYGPYTVGYTGLINLYFSPEHLWDINTENERHVYICEAIQTYYLTNNKKWSSCYYYTWTGSKYEKSWPGTIMTFVETNGYGEDIYSCTFSTMYTYIIFNNGKGEQTIDIKLSDYSTNAFYLKDKSNGKYGVGGWNYGN